MPQGLVRSLRRLFRMMPGTIVSRSIGLECVGLFVSRICHLGQLIDQLAAGPSGFAVWRFFGFQFRTACRRLRELWGRCFGSLI